MIKNNLLLLASIFFTNYGFSSPNILIILADDLGWNDVSYHGSEIKTPNIDELISSGVELDRFYVQPTCSPTRAELMTGKSAIRLGITRPISKNQKLGLGLNEKILPQYLKEMNYDKNNSWPETEKKYLEKTNVDYVIQINGKKRSLINAEKDLKQELLFELVKKDKLLDKYLTDISIKKIIFVKNRLMNILI